MGGCRESNPGREGKPAGRGRTIAGRSDPKEPPPDPKAVRLLTIHAAKGLEFDYVWLMGLAESILPSWQSLKAGAQPAELEEERRNLLCRNHAHEGVCLVLSRAESYRGWRKEPSRFLVEMELLGENNPA